jgi:hypothetical protein
MSDVNVHAAPRTASDSTTALPERRAESRSLSRRLVVVRFERDGGTIYRAARIWNVCTEGIGLLLDPAPPPGLAVRLQFRHAAVRDRGATVLNTAAEGAAWVVNCRLEQPLSPTELQALSR